MLGERDPGAEAEGDFARRWGGADIREPGPPALGLERESCSGLELEMGDFWWSRQGARHWEVFKPLWKELNV